MKNIIISILLMSVIYFLITMVLVKPAVERKIPEPLLKKCLTQKEKFKDQIPNSRYMIVVDYSRPISDERLWLYDTENDTVLLYCRVSHALESGKVYARRFSNIPDSEISPKGAFITQEKYNGKWGKSMRIGGLESCNDNTRKRFIVFHPSTLQYSKGCFMLKRKQLSKLIDYAKNGTFMYVSD